MSEHIFQAARLIDGVVERAHQMTVSPSRVRAELLAECLPLFEQMRVLNTRRFCDSRSIAEAIDACERGVRAVAELREGRITEDRRDGRGRCPACDASIKRIAERCVLCTECSKLYIPAKLDLESEHGFGTEWI